MSVKRQGQTGFVLAMVLMLSVLFLVIGIGFISSKAALYKGVGQSDLEAQAQALAEAGMEDARVKLDKDPDFPPPGGLDQFVFSYSENLLDTSGNLIGFYEIQIDSTHRVYPYSVVKIRSIGRVGERGRPSAQHTIEAELDITAVSRSDSSLPNPRNFQFHRWNSSKNS